jgi:hypothetical protein
MSREERDALKRRILAQHPHLVRELTGHKARAERKRAYPQHSRVVGRDRAAGPPAPVPPREGEVARGPGFGRPTYRWLAAAVLPARRSKRAGGNKTALALDADRRQLDLLGVHSASLSEPRVHLRPATVGSIRPQATPVCSRPCRIEQ